MKKVRFAQDAQVRRYDADEAPANNIYEIVDIREDDRMEDESNDSEMVVVGTQVVFEGKSPSPQNNVKSYILFDRLDGKTYENFDTDEMTVNELKEVLSQRGLSTKGKKCELKRRLEEDIIANTSSPLRKKSRTEQQGNESIQARDKKCPGTETPEWLRWD